MKQTRAMLRAPRMARRKHAFVWTEEGDRPADRATDNRRATLRYRERDVRITRV